MSTAKELLAKNIQKSHSSSSLLLSSANLSWTPTSTAILVTPQPALERTVSPQTTTTTLTNDEIIQSLRLDTNSTSSRTSSEPLDESFQTISLCDRRCDDNDCDNTSTDGQTSRLQKLSIIEQLFSGHSLLKSAGGSSSGRLSVDSTCSSQSAPAFATDSRNTSLSGVTDVSFTAHTSAPPMPSAPPQRPAPPKVDFFVGKDYKRKGPLRLYDPNHGSTTTTGATDDQQHRDISALNAQLPLPSDIPYVQPLPETLYNPSDYYPSADQPLEGTGAHTDAYSDLGVGVDANQPAIGSENDSHFSFISETPNYVTESQLPNSTDWPPVAAPVDQTSPVVHASPPSAYHTYEPVVYHWFYQQIIENKAIWRPFSMYDTYNLEQSVLSSAGDYGYGSVIATNGGRFDVSVFERTRRPVYWQDVDTIVRRCSWFYKEEGHNRWAPYEEEVAERLEACFRDCMHTQRWNQRVELTSGATEVVVMHSATTVYHYVIDQCLPDGWGQAVDNPNKPRQVHRCALDGIFDDIDEGEPEQIDHLVFLIHGIGEICDIRFRSIVEVVDDFRDITLGQMRVHYRPYLESGQLGRIELLPISWHSSLHGEETGIDDRLKQITLQSIPKLRHFSNDTILDALFYTSPVYCQTIVDNVGQELNRLFALFCQRNPNYCGTVALGGHSLGSLIVFDILAHQVSEPSSGDGQSTPDGADDVKTCDDLSEKTQQMNEFFAESHNQCIQSLLEFIGFPEFVAFFADEQRLDFQTVLTLTDEDFRRDERLRELPIGLQKNLQHFIHNFVHNKCAKSRVEGTAGPASPVNSFPFESLGLGFPAIRYPTLAFRPSAFFAMGSPIPMFLTVRGIQYLSPEFRLPTCAAVYNIFHPYDPIAYRLEPMIYRCFKDIKPVLIPHHKGRKRMHLELRDSIARMGSDIKNKIYDSLKYTWNSINEFARAHKTAGASTAHTMTTSASDGYLCGADNSVGANDLSHKLIDNYDMSSVCDEEPDGYAGASVGALNSGRRIDYVLQESPVEAFNEYLFALSAHACYWQSEDTALLILRELYGQLGFYSASAETPTVATADTSHTIPTSASVDHISGQLFDDTNVPFISN